MKDPKFLGEAKRARLAIRPLTFTKVQKLMRRTFASDPKLLQRVREILR
ncbi:MAG: hypothetical protein ACE5JU_09195 [Candidatus Binatia bacterium]